MTSDWKTNFVYFSSLLPERYPRIFKRIEKILNNENIPFDFIYNTADIWCRDYMPVQITETKFVQFKFDPDYLRKEPYKKLKTDQNKIIWNHSGRIYLSNITLDGGGLVWSENSVIISEKIFELNKHLKPDEIIERLMQIFKQAKIYFIPCQPYEIFGHVDSMIRFIDDNTILVNDFSHENKKFQDKFNQALNKMPFTTILSQGGDIHCVSYNIKKI